MTNLNPEVPESTPQDSPGRKSGTGESGIGPVPDDETIARAIDWESLESVLKTNLDFAGAIAGAGQKERPENEPPVLQNPAQEGFRELVLHLKSIAESQEDLLERMDDLEKSLNETRRGMAVQMTRMRDELIGERKITLVRSTFDTVVAQLDSLRFLHVSLNPKNNGRFLQQLVTIELCLTNIILGMGFREFTAAEGEPFDPGRMKSMGYLDGEPGVVLKAVLPGYMAGDVIIRPAGVFIANPASK